MVFNSQNIPNLYNMPSIPRPHRWRACLYIRFIRFTRATALTLEVQGSEAQASQGVKNHGRYIGVVETRPDPTGWRDTRWRMES